MVRAAQSGAGAGAAADPGVGAASGGRPGVLASAAVALLAGVLHTAAFAPTEAWWAQLLALALLAAGVRGARPARAALWGWAFGLGWLASGLWWLYISMHRYGGLSSALAAGAVLLLAAALALYVALAMALAAAVCRPVGGAWVPAARHGAGTHAGEHTGKQSGIPAGIPAGVGAAAAGQTVAGAVARVAAFAGCWLLAELARASWFTGFPWGASGYAHTTGPLAGWAPWVGVYGIGALAAALAAALAEVGAAVVCAVVGAAPGAGAARRAGPAAVLGWVLCPVLGLCALGPWLPAEFTRDTGRLSVSLVQPNIPQDLKFDAEQWPRNLERLAQAVVQAPGALVVTPESVVPMPFEVVDPAYWRRLQAAVSAPGRAALLGVFIADDQGRYVNSLLGLDGQTRWAPGPQALTTPGSYRYGKRHLLPFGEFIPPGFEWFVRALAIPMDDQGAGRHQQAYALAGQRLRPLICYEDLFGEDFVASVVGPEAATVLVNASNLAWFGRWMVQDQHLQFSRMRALEFQRPVVRATNTGATAVVDHRGRVTHRLPPDVAGVLNAEVTGRVGDTPYARGLHRAGLWPGWALGLALLGLAGAARARARGRLSPAR